jgi:hypothetical protein
LILSSSAVSLLIGGTAVLWQQNERFRFTQGTSSVAPDTWPRLSKLARPADLPCLLVFVHEECPCTRATFVELQKVLTRCRKKLAIKIVFVRYNLKSHFIASQLEQLASTIPEAKIEFVDPAEARAFGATTSGFVALFDRSGSLLYHGGITSGRGHEGDNVAEDTLVSSINCGIGTRRELPTYGCSL